MAIIPCNRNKKRSMESDSSNANHSKYQHREGSDIDLGERVPCFSTGSLSIYHKFFSHLEVFYNEHDLLSIVTALLYPCCSPTLIRSTNLWNNLLYSKLPHEASSNNSSCLIATKVQTGLDSLEKSYSNIFTCLPDCVIIYYPISVKPSHDGFTPFHYLCIRTFSLSLYNS